MDRDNDELKKIWRDIEDEWGITMDEAMAEKEITSDCKWKRESSMPCGQEFTEFNHIIKVDKSAIFSVTSTHYDRSRKPRKQGGIYTYINGGSILKNMCYIRI